MRTNRSMVVSETECTRVSSLRRSTLVGLVSGLLVSVGLVVAGCGGGSADSGAPTAQAAEIIAIDDEGVSVVDESGLERQLDEMAPLDLSEADAEGLAFMREEEKLAGDVYQALYEIWGLRIFDNIQRAEQTHTAAVKTLLDRYDLTDPAIDRVSGDFQNPTIQGLYDDLVARGSESLVEALTVGVLIEELDISDLQARASTNSDIDLVYANLEKGSRNHLRAFLNQLERNGGTYTPQYLDPDVFAAIAASDTERGPNR